MIQTSPQMKIYVAKEPINFQKRMDGTAAICRLHYEKDPYGGAVFVFINRRKTMIRLYFFDGQGEWLCDKRIAKGRFQNWITSGQGLNQLEAHQLHVLVRGGNPKAVKTPPDWRKLS